MSTITISDCLIALDKFKNGSYTNHDMKSYIKEVLSNPDIRKSNPYLYNDYINTFNIDSTTKIDTVSIYENNPLYAVQEDNYKVFIEPNVISYNEALNESNNKRFKPYCKKEIQNLLKDSLSCYKSDNGYYYLETNNKLIEIEVEQQYEVIKKYYLQLEEAIRKIVPLSTLLPLEPLKGYIPSNDNIIKFKDGIFNIKTGEEIEYITKETIPVSKSDVNFNYNPSSYDKKITTDILCYKFVKPVELIKHLSDIMFNDTTNKLKQFSIVFGVSDSGKSSFKENELKHIFGSKEVDIDNYTNTRERTALTGNCKVITCDEIQRNVIDSPFLNKYTGSKYIPVEEKYNKDGGITIKTKHPFFFGENILSLHNQSKGTYNRLFIIETQNIITDLTEKQLEYMNSQEYIDTIFQLMKEEYNKDSTVLYQNITPDQYKKYDNSLTSVMKQLIKEEPVYEVPALTDKENTIFAIRNNPNFLDEDSIKYFICLDYYALKIMLKQAQLEGTLDPSYDVMNISINTLKEILSGFVDNFNPNNVFNKTIAHKRKNLRIDIQPTKKGHLILKRAFKNKKAFKHEDNRVLEYCTLYNPEDSN